jgi:hypothetical protein
MRGRAKASATQGAFSVVAERDVVGALSRASTSADLDSIAVELAWAGSRAQILGTCEKIVAYLRSGGFPNEYIEYLDVGRTARRNFAQRLSTALAQKVADALRLRGMPEIFPDEFGRGHESKSRGASGLKKLDVNYSRTDMGLGLAVSIKTINFKDVENNRFTKNMRRVDGELRAEAQDCHKRQPFAVLAAVILLPRESAFDRGTKHSSLKHAWRVFSKRGSRRNTDDDPSLFENVFLGTYEDSPAERAGKVQLFDASVEPPDEDLPAATVSFSAVVDRIYEAFRNRNRL